VTTETTSSEAMSPDPGSAAPAPPERPLISARLAALGGIVGVAVVVGVAELLAALGSALGITSTATSASPLVGLGSTFIQFTPEWLKQFAIATFGVHDKDALKVGMGLTLVGGAAILGLIARRKLMLAIGALGLLGVVVAVAVYTRAEAGIVDILPTVLAVALGAVVFLRLFRPVTSASYLSEPADAGAADGRRRFLRYTAGGVGLAAVSGGLSRLVPTSAGAERSQLTAGQAAAAATVEKLPPIPAGASLEIPYITPFITSNADFYRIDTSLIEPRLDASKWSLRIYGMVDREIVLDYNELLARPLLERMVTLTCVSNEVGGDLAGNAIWQGPLIRDLLAEAGPRADADMVMSRSGDGFSASTPLSVLLDKDRDAIFAVTMNGEVLPFAHGFPVRMVVPGLYGFVSATKWVVELEVTRFDRQTAYWTDRGWSPRGPIKTSSRIDVPRSFEEVPAGKYAMGGVAWAQHRGIASVEVQIDGGEWRKADLSDEFTTDSWRQWSYVWDATPGKHSVRCRAIDSTGAVQIEAEQPPIPDGATGYDSTAFAVK
jgi:DMSO/TMAO reductase YedYZ molybdopterin-dependent catalytic subunit